MQVSEALTGFVDRYLAEFPVLTQPFDPEWRSPCETGGPIDRGSGAEPVIRWRPQPRSAVDFGGLEHALELTIHPDVKEYYGTFFSGNLEAEAADGHVSLILLWNDADTDRLVENLIGHALAKRRAREPMTVFFACTEPDSELFLSVDNASGAVLLEQPGRKPLRQVAGSLAEFIESLAPAAPDVV